MTPRKLLTRLFRNQPLRVATALLLTACTQSAWQGRTELLVPSEPRAVGCTFELYSDRPQIWYREIAVLEPNAPHSGSLSSFAQELREVVCSHGGDGIIAHLNAQGHFTKATVVQLFALPVMPEDTSDESIWRALVRVPH